MNSFTKYSKVPSKDHKARIGELQGCIMIREHLYTVAMIRFQKNRVHTLLENSYPALMKDQYLISMQKYAKVKCMSIVI